MAECCVEDVRLVDHAAIQLRRPVPHIRPRMDGGFPVRPVLLNCFSPRALIPDTSLYAPTHNKKNIVEFTSTTVFSTCSTCASTSRSSSVVNSRRPSRTPRRRSSFLTLGRAVETRLLSISVCATLSHFFETKTITITFFPSFFFSVLPYSRCCRRRYERLVPRRRW